MFVAKCGPIMGGVEPMAPLSDQLLIYANPNEGICTIDVPEDFRHETSLILTIYNNQGKLIQKVPVILDGDRVTLNISAEAAGMYQVILTNGKKNYTGKIVFK